MRLRYLIMIRHLRFYIPVLLLALLIVLLAAGCSAPVSPPSEVAEGLSPTPEATATRVSTSTPTPTASPTASPTLTPTDTPTSTPTSTPTPVVPEQLSQARQAMVNGDYASAVSHYNAFLSAFPDSPQADDARFELARAWLAAGEPGQAIPLLETLAGNQAAIDRSPEILWWLGRAYSDVDARKAADAYLRYAELSPELKLDALFAAADVLLAAKDAKGAADAYNQVLSIAPDLATAFRAREGLADAALLDDNFEEAIAQYQAIIEQARNPAYRSKILYQLGQLQARAGREEEAWASYRQAIQESNSSYYAYLSLVELVNAEQPVDDRLRAEIDVQAEAYLPAIGILTKLLAGNPEDAADLHRLLARAYEGLEDYASAAGAWRQVLASTTDEAVKNEAWMGLGRSLWRQGLRDEARKVYLQAAEQSTDPDAAATALWWAAVLAGQDNGRWEQAAADFLWLAHKFPDSDYADQAGFRAGLINYRLGNFDVARALWQEHAGAGDSTWHAAAHFWLGKLLMEQGKEQEALAHWQETARRWDETDFYGVRARQKLQEAGIAPTPTPASDETGDQQEAMVWAAGLAGQDVSVFTQTPPEFRRIQELHRVGEESTAHRELEALRRQWKEDPVKLLQVSLFARELGYYDTSIRAARQLVALSGKPLMEAPRYVQELVYPTPYEELVLAAAGHYGVDPALFYALIRQESLFWAPASSYVGAMGLTQIMPGTGKSAARQLAMEDFQVSDLLKPYISLNMGAYILSEELRRNDGDVLRSLAAYNAGPGNASFWWELSDGDPDLFVELISFRETQHYVRTITVQANHYRRLYPELR